MPLLNVNRHYSQLYPSNPSRRLLRMVRISVQSHWPVILRSRTNPEGNSRRYSSTPTKAWNNHHYVGTKRWNHRRSPWFWREEGMWESGIERRWLTSPRRNREAFGARLWSPHRNHVGTFSRIYTEYGDFRACEIFEEWCLYTSDKHWITSLCWSPSADVGALEQKFLSIRSSQGHISHLSDSIRSPRGFLRWFYVHGWRIVWDIKQNYRSRSETILRSIFTCAVSSLRLLRYPSYHTNLSRAIFSVPPVLLRNWIGE